MQNQGSAFPFHLGENTCQNICAQYADVSLPIHLKPTALLGAVKTECCGAPSICLRPGGPGGCGCELTITQTVCIHIPIEYGAQVLAEDATAHCRPIGQNCPPTGHNCPPTGHNCPPIPNGMGNPQPPTTSQGGAYYW